MPSSNLMPWTKPPLSTLESVSKHLFAVDLHRLLLGVDAPTEDDKANGAILRNIPKP